MRTIVKHLFGASLLGALSACGGGDVSKFSDEEKASAPQEIIIDEFDNSGGESTPGTLSPSELALLPVVIANSSQQYADANVLVRLNGSAEVASNNDGETSISATVWSQVSGPDVELLSAGSLSNLFIAPDVSETSQLVFMLAAQDSNGRVNADTVSVVVQPIDALVRVIGGIVNETDGVAEFTIKLLEVRDEALLVRYITKSDTAVEGEDYEAARGELTFLPGETEKTITINVLADNNAEDFESFSLQVTAIANENTSSNIASVVIRNVDDTLPSIPPTIIPTAPPPSIEPTPTAPPPSVEPSPTVPPSPTSEPVVNLHSPEWDLPDAAFQLSGNRINFTLEDEPTYDIHPAFIDGDNDLDVLMATNTAIELLTNDGSGNFSRTTIVSDAPTFNRFIRTADLDRDGDLDILSRSSNFELVWYENTGTGLFTEQEIPTTQININQVEVVDMDRDGDIDIAVTLFSGAWTWFENTGEGFLERNVVADARISSADMQPVDFDNDGDVDIILGGTAPVILLSNDNQQNFTPSEVVNRECFDLQAIDFNGDSSIDLLCSSSDGRTLDLLQNSIELGFTPINIANLSTGRIGELQVYDWDNDLDMDIFVSSISDGNNALNIVGFYENDSGSFSGSPDIPIEKFSQLHEFGDFDGDGRTDIIFNWENHNLSLVQQVQTDVFQIRELFTTFNVVGEMQNIDVDNDGDVDLVGMSEVFYFSGEGIDSKYFYFLLENDATQPANFKILKVLYDIEATAHLASDIDRDGDIDFLTGTDVYNSGFNFYESQTINDTIQPSFTIGSYIIDQPVFIERAFTYEEPFNEILSFIADDFNFDGSRDIAFSNRAGLAVLLFNDGNQNFNTYTSIADAAYSQIFARDIDFNESVDLVTDRGFWYPNASDSVEPSIITDLAEPSNQTELEDIDADGDFDYLLINDQTMYVLENDGNANFTLLPDLQVTTEQFRPQLFGAINDYWGLSLLSLSKPDGPGDITVNWHSNVANPARIDRKAAVLPPLELANYGAAETLALSDFNADGKEDLLMGFGEELAWYEFVIEPDFQIQEGQTDVGAVTASDADGDSLSYSISGGADGELFNIDATSGDLAFNSIPFHGEPGDADGDNFYEVELTVSDGENENSRTFIILVAQRAQ